MPKQKHWTEIEWPNGVPNPSAVQPANPLPCPACGVAICFTCGGCHQCENLADDCNQKAVK